VNLQVLLSFVSSIGQIHFSFVINGESWEKNRSLNGIMHV
jgi:hypothetical protein